MLLGGIWLLLSHLREQRGLERPALCLQLSRDSPYANNLMTADVENLGSASCSSRLFRQVH